MGEFKLLSTVSTPIPLPGCQAPDPGPDPGHHRGPDQDPERDLLKSRVSTLLITLVETKMTKELQGGVTCTAISGQETATTHVQVELKQAPCVSILGEAVQYTSIGGTAILSCEVGNYYDNTEVTWRIGERKKRR